MAASSTVDPVAPTSLRCWLSDLEALRRDAPFADVSWSADESDRIVRAHKCIVYARATGTFQQRYLVVPHSISSESDLSLYGHSIRTFTPSSTSHGGDSLSPYPEELPSISRSSSSTERSNSSAATAIPSRPIALGTTDINLVEAALDFYYTASKQSEAFAVVLEGFSDAEDGEDDVDVVERLRQDLLYCWRSKLYADVQLSLEGVDSASFAAHRAILACRSPYFRSLLLGSFGDSLQTEYTLPSPPFTPASTTFVLGYIYAGTLDFSARKFDLTTACEIWRCAAYLAMSSLQAEIETKIVGMLNLARAPRIFAFAHAADVGQPRLAKAALPLVLDRFEETWAGPCIGHLPYDVQKQLVRHICAAIKPDTVAKVARKVSSLRKRMDGDRSVWADHVRSMLEAIEEELVAVLAADLSATIASTGFVDLIDGVGFSTDVLEWILTLVVKGLVETKAAEAYQALVGSVLLREEGILADARVLVEDAKNGILKYIKRKWINIRSAGGFDDLESWCLKELADELEMTADDLVADGPRIRPSPARSRQPPKRLLEGASRTAAASSPSKTPSRPPRASESSTGSGAADPAGAASARRGSTARISEGSAPIRAISAARPPTRVVHPSPVSSGLSRSRPTPSTALPPPPPRTPPVSARQARATRSIVAPPSAPSVSSTQSDNAPSPGASRPPSSIRSVSRRPAHGGVTARRTTPNTGTDGPITSMNPPLRKQSSTTSINSSRSNNNAPSLRRPSSSGSLSTSRRPASVASSVASRRTGSAAKSTAQPEVSRATVASSPATRPARAHATSTPAKARVPPLPRRAGAALPGTSLLAGIPCIATVRVGRPFRVKAMVRYIGQLEGETGQWVGVEARESAIPPEAAELPWNDGSKNGVVYFALTPPERTPGKVASGVDTAESSSRTNATDNPNGSAASLRPPPRRARRSTSAESSGTGPRKGLFVRPDQILYVM